MLIRLNIDIEDVDYIVLIDKLSRQKITPSLAFKALVLKIKAKFKNKTQDENDKAFLTLINANNEKITKAVNTQISKLGADGYIRNINAQIINKKDVIK